MQYYSDIQENEDGYFIVSKENRVLSINKTARYRINLPVDPDYNEHLGPYAVEEKAGRNWVKIGVLSSAKQNSRKQAHSKRIDKQQQPSVKNSSIKKHRTDIGKPTAESNQNQEFYEKQEMATAPQMIYDHLGGKKFMIQIGATDIREGISTLSFKIKKNPNDIRYINIMLNELDRFDVEFLKVKNYEVNTLKELYNIHPNDLHNTISHETGIAVNC
jgi:hypothetical protein